MIYLDNGATSFPKPAAVSAAVDRAIKWCANPGRGGHRPAMEAAETVYRCRERAGKFFDCPPERVAFTMNCTHGLNIAIRSLVKPGDRVVVSGFEHNAVVRPLHSMGARIQVVGRRLFDWEDTLSRFEDALKQQPAAAVFTHVSNVFGYVLPVAEIGALCRQYGVPFVLDAAQSAGTEEVSLEKLGAAYIAMPGHKGLQGPMGTGLLLCGETPEPIFFGGTGTESASWEMPAYLPERLEAGTVNVPGIAGLEAGIAWVMTRGREEIRKREMVLAKRCTTGLKKLGLQVFSGPHQAGTVSFVPDEDAEELAQKLGQRGICVRAGMHCASLAHESAGTLDTGTVRVSFGPQASLRHMEHFLENVKFLRMTIAIDNAFRYNRKDNRVVMR